MTQASNAFMSFAKDFGDVLKKNNTSI
jgi:hypothetical protein